MLRYALTAILISNLFGSAYAFSYEGPEHIGALCTFCHDKFSSRQPYAANLSAAVKSTDVTDIFPCYKRACHFSSSTAWRARGNRYGLHMQGGICMNCHGKNGEFDIHKSHTRGDNTTVECSICHATLEGWNSSRVQVPPYSEIYVAGSALLNTSIRVPSWQDDCGYCHMSVENASRQHDVHEQVIEQVCVECHGEIIESIPNPLKEAIIEGGPSNGEVEPSLARTILSEYHLLFENISLQLLNFYNYLREDA